MGCFVYVLFGTCKDITLGPTAILSLVTASITDNCVQDPEQYDRRISCAITLTFFSGVIQFALGLLNLGELWEELEDKCVDDGGWDGEVCE